MKISETTSHPHPVLSSWSDDIIGAEISTTITFREMGDANQISLHCKTDLDHPDITSLIECGSAIFGCYIHCQETGFRRLQRIGFPTGVHHFAPGELLGRVRIRPMVWAEKTISNYSPLGMHAEFGKGSDIEPGHLLALEGIQIIEVTRPPIAPAESIFEILASKEVSDRKFEIDTQTDRITIRMSPSTFELVQTLRQTNDQSRAAIMNGLFVPVMMEVLDQIRDGYEQFEQFRWLHPFRARCEAAEIDPERIDLLNDAQKLLEQPFASLSFFAQETDL